MNSHTSKYAERNRPIRKVERFILKIIIFVVIPICCVLGIVYPTGKISNSLPVLFSLAGLIQLEVAGLFEYIDYLGNELEKIYDESGRVPSNITRAIYEYYNPEPTVKAFINNQLYLNKRVGFYLLLIGGLIQLFTIWLV
ncbi:TPA: hypothetical protein I8652_001651 [Legionella pneumophila]|nr:hypothetical protein [Legionella pneumophila]